MKEFAEKLIERLEESVSFTKTAKMESRVGKKQTIGFVLGVRSAVKIIKDLAEEYKECALCYFGSPCEYQNKDAIFPTELLAEDNGWISCEERLPNTEDHVLVCATGRDEGVFIAYFEEETEKWRYDTDEGIYYYVDVIAWQPLPAPYKKGE